MFDIITKENEVAFNEKIELDDEVRVVNSPKNLSGGHLCRRQKHRPNRQVRSAADDTSKIITRGVDDYLDEIEAENAEAKAQAEAEAKANKEEYLRYLKEERRNALITAAWYLEKAYSLDHMIAGLEDDN